MFWLILALAGSTSSASSLQPQCRDAPAVINTLIHEEPRPLGMTISFATDHGVGKLLHFRTTHFLGYPGLPFREGSSSVTYYTHLNRRVCELPLDAENCPELKTAEEALRSRAYPVSSVRQLIPNSAFHNPSILLHAKDGDGNTLRIRSERSDHPVAKDVVAAFSAIARCTTEADREIYESD